MLSNLFQTTIFEMHFRFLLHIWVRVDGRPISQQIYNRTSSNSIRKETGCNKYVEDQLNVARKNLRLIKKMVTNVWKILAP